MCVCVNRRRGAIPARAVHGDSLSSVKLLIFLLAAPLWAQTMSEDDLFSELNLAAPGLGSVAAAVRTGDRAAARHALAEYYRHRSKPLFYITPGSAEMHKTLGLLQSHSHCSTKYDDAIEFACSLGS